MLDLRFVEIEEHEERALYLLEVKLLPPYLENTLCPQILVTFVV
jgi:hypothetical protein